jgi:hypothetical protein
VVSVFDPASSGPYMAVHAGRVIRGNSESKDTMTRKMLKAFYFASDLQYVEDIHLFIFLCSDHVSQCISYVWGRAS